MEIRKCTSCGASIPNNTDRCEYCGSYYNIERPIRGNRAKGNPIDDWCIDNIKSMTLYDRETGNPIFKMGPTPMLIGKEQR